MPDSVMLTPKMVEERFQIPVGTLANMRWQGRGPEYVKMGRKVLYRFDDLQEYFAQRRVRTAD